MKDFLHRFGDTTDAKGNPAFSNSHKGTIVGLLSIGTMLGALLAAPIADRLGRKMYVSAVLR
jgi:MFS transporter, SP family, sugar:H+ symporter